MSRSAALLFVTGCAFLFSACDRKQTDVREWRASDHDHTAEPNSAQAAPQASAGADAGGGDDHGVDEVTIVAWKQNCVRCHGVVGRGDGVEGASVRASDLSRPEWQTSVTDAQIAATIQNGKGAMPAFPLPSSTITGLVRLVRLLNVQPPAAAPAAGAPSPAGDGGAPPATAERE
jgi:mono/diheme cytochrome c family protein